MAEAAGSVAETVEAPGRGREYRSLLALVTTKSLMSNMLRPVLPVYAVVLGAPAAAIGLIVALPDLVQVVARIPAGALSSDIGRRGPMVACFFMSTAAGLALCLAPSYTLLFPGQLLWGLSVAAFWPTVWAYLIEVMPADRQATAIGIGLGMSGIGILAGPLIGGAVADAAGWRAPFVMYTAISVLCLLMALSLPRARGGPWRQAMALKNLLHAYRRAVPVGLRPGVFLAAGCQFLAFALEGLQLAYLPLRLHDLGYTATVIGAVIATRKAAAAALRFAFPVLARLSPDARLAWVGLGLDIAGVSAMAFLDRPVALMLVGVFSGIGVGIGEPAAKSLITGATGPEDRALGLGVEGTTANLGKSFGAMLFGALAGPIGIIGAFAATCAAVAAACPVVAAFNRANDRRARQEMRHAAAK